MPKTVIALSVGLTWIALSMAMMWPPICRYGGKDANRGVQSVSCVDNLRQIEIAKKLFALDSGHTNGPIDPAQLDRFYLYGQSLKCPSGGTYFYGDIGQFPVCSLSTNTAPTPVKERLGPFFWQWKVWPSPGPAAHKLPQR